MNNRTQEQLNEAKEKREKIEKNFQEMLKQEAENKEFQKLIHAEVEYQRLISQKEFLRRRRFVFFLLQGKKLNALPPKNDNGLDDHQPGNKFGV